MTVSSSKPRVLISINTAWNLVNFRTGLIKSLVDAGYEVVAAAPHDEYAQRLESTGSRYVELPMDSAGTNPWQDAKLWWRYRQLMQLERPDVFLGYTVKPNIYGSIAAHSLGIPVINNIAGLGAVFISQSLVTRVVRLLYRLALHKAAHVFFQNRDDQRLFHDSGLVNAARTSLIPGSGIDLKRFRPTEDSDKPGTQMCFLLVARMLWDKGVGEYVEAARLLRHQFPNVRFALLGFLDVQNPAAISRDQMASWVAEGVVEYWGTSEDVRQQISQADAVVLPSYREGTPRTLLEAAAMAKPLVATNAVGCREVVEHGINGLLCDVRSTSSLADALRQMITMPLAERVAMGHSGRQKMESQFDERKVIDAYLQALARALSTQSKGPKKA